MASKKIGKTNSNASKSAKNYFNGFNSGSKRGKGTVEALFDNIIEDEMWGEKSWERLKAKLD